MDHTLAQNLLTGQVVDKFFSRCPRFLRCNKQQRKFVLPLSLRRVYCLIQENNFNYTVSNPAPIRDIAPSVQSAVSWILM
jgi:hypothetical protein